jgi:protein involved in polysaccharide export with SLBB domain
MPVRWFVLAVLALLAAAAFAQPIRPADRLRLACPQEPALEGEYTVLEDGVVQLPLLGIVTVGGLEPSEAARLVERLLREEKLVGDPKVSITVVGAPAPPATAPARPTKPVPPKAAPKLPTRPVPMQSKKGERPVEPVFGKIRVVGAVTAPLEIDAVPGMSLAMALERVQPLDDADLGAVLVSRRDGSSMSYDCALGTPTLLLEDGDVVEIPRLTGPRSVTVLGGVATPGAVEHFPGLTVADAVERCGGLQPGTEIESVVVVRGAQRLPVRWPDEARTVMLRGGETVEVLALGGGSSVVVRGAVRRPGHYAGGHSTTLGEVIRSAGGAVPGADLKRVGIRRVGSEKPVFVDYLEIEQGMRGDILLSAGDQVFVEGPGKRRYGPGAAAGFVGLAWFLLGR